MIYLITQTLARGKKIGFASMLGFGMGITIHALLVACGLSLMSHIDACVYGYQISRCPVLILLGFEINRCRRRQSRHSSPKQASNGFWAAWLRAIVIDLTNPKVALFFIAFLPQFYRADGSSKVVQFMELGLIIALMGFAVESIIILLADRIAFVLHRRAGISKLIDSVFGTVMIALGIRLLLKVHV